MSKEEKIKILHVEDLATDAELVARTLKKSGLSFDIIVADNEKDFTRELADFSPDLILSDHSLPHFSSLGALKILRERQLDIPFILITSTTSEEIAVNVMREGAWDYILKDRMQRLPAAVANALEKSKSQQEKQKYIEKIIFNEKRFRSLIESIEDIIVLIDANHHVIYRSPNFERITGWSFAELAEGDRVLTHPEDQSIIGDILKQAITSPQEHFTFTIRLKHKSGRYLVMEGIATSLLNDGLTNSTVFTLRDVTEKKKAERELQSTHERLGFHIENSPLGFIEWDNQLRVKSWSARTTEIFGWTEQESKENERTGHNLVFSNDEPAVKKKLGELLSGEVVRNHIQNRNCTKSGKVIWCNWFNSVLKNDDGEVVAIMSLVQDITESKEAEVRVRQSEANLNAIIENTDANIYSLDGNFRYTRFNNTLKKSLKRSYNIDIAIGDPVFDFLNKMNPGEAKEWERIYSQALSGTTIKFEKEFSVGGNHQWFSFSINPILENGQVIGLSCFARDITQQVNAQNKITASEKRFRSLVENITDGIVVSDINQNLLYQSPSVTKILGYTEEERKNRSLKSYVHPDYVSQYTEIHEAARKDTEPHPFEYPFLHKNGTYVWLEGVVTNLLNEPSVGGIVANYRDVTQRKMLNEILKEYNDRHEVVSKATNDAIWDWDIERDYEIWNHGTETIFGYKEREVNSSRSWWKEKIHPDDYHRVNQDLAEAFKRKADNWSAHYQYLCANGSYKHVWDRAYILYKDDRPVRMIGAMQDITEQVINQQKLTSLNERYEIVLNTTGEAMWDWDLVNNTILWGEGLFDLYGYSEKGQVPASFWSDKIHPEDRNHIEIALLAAFGVRSKIKWEDEYRFRKSNGAYAFVHDRGTIIRNEDGHAIRMVGSMQDITERKLATEEIEKLSLVASKTDSLVIITDDQERIEWVNESFVKLTGYTLNESIGRKPNELLQGPETDRLTLDRIRKHVQARQPITEEVLNYSKGGTKYWLRININPVFNNQGILTKFIAIESDITHQKEYEQNIVTIAKELTDLIENANVPIFGVDRNGYINEWNKTTTAISGFSKNEVLGKKWIDFVHSKEQKKANQIINKAFAGTSTPNFEFPFASKNGKQLVLFISVSTRRDVNKNVIGALFVGQDLTEVIEYRQGLEKLVKERTHELQEALTKEKQLVEMKSKFVSIASHEFRTPLSTISLATGFIRKYKNKMAAEDVDAKLNNIEKQVSQMTYLLDDVLLVGKAEAGEILINRSEIQLSTFEKLAAEVVESKKTKHRLRFSGKCSVSSIMSDEKLIRNIIINLITNAVKFSPEANEVEMKIMCDHQNLQIVVKDHGIGIPEQDLKELYTSFSRGSNVGAIEGTGLGLSIVKKAVDLLHGTIELKSKEGKGSEFKITLPI